MTAARLTDGMHAELRDTDVDGSDTDLGPVSNINTRRHSISTVITHSIGPTVLPHAFEKGEFISGENRITVQDTYHVVPDLKFLDFTASFGDETLDFVSRDRVGSIPLLCVCLQHDSSVHLRPS
jgi:hypothetical protein